MRNLALASNTAYCATAHTCDYLLFFSFFKFLTLLVVTYNKMKVLFERLCLITALRTPLGIHIKTSYSTLINSILKFPEWQ